MKLYSTTFFVIALVYATQVESADLNDKKIEELFNRELEIILNEGPRNRLYNRIFLADGNNRLFAISSTYFAILIGCLIY